MIECDRSIVSPFEAPRRLELESGLVIPLPSQRALADLGLTENEYLLRELGAYSALKVEQTGASGDPVLVTDNTEAILGLGAAIADALGGCGCDGLGGVGGSLFGVAVAAGLVARRRR